MIKIDHISKKLDTTLAVNDFSMTFENGIYGIVGENGAGKSTLFRLISGIFTPDSGTITVDDIPANDIRSKNKVFFLTDDPYSPTYATLKTTIDFYASIFDLDIEKCKQFLSKTILDQNKSIGSFSKGMRRQAFLCIALAIRAQYLLLDEAFDGLDPLAMDWIKTEIIRKSIEEKSTILIASHNIETLDKLVDRYYLMRKGHLFSTGDVQGFNKEFVCLQCYFPSEVTIDQIRALKIFVMNFKKVGAVYEITVMNRENLIEDLKAGLNPSICEEIPLSATDIIALEMQKARMEGFNV